MKTMALLLATALASAGTAAAPVPAPTYRVTGSVAGPDGGWDYARVDPAANRLYVARSTSVTVIDTATAKVLGSIGTLDHGHAVLPLPSNRLLTTSGNDASVYILDARDGHALARLPVGKKPDAAILSNDGKFAFVMNAKDGSVSVIDIASMKLERTIAVKPALEYGAQGADGTLFVNNEEANDLDVVDVARGTTGPAIPLTGCEGPTGLAYDSKTDRLIAACANGKAAIVDARRRRIVGTVDIGQGPDAVILDAARRLAFVPCGKDGVLDVLPLDGAQVRRVGRITTAVGARTGALDPTTGAIYLPTASFDPPAQPGARPNAKPGTFRVLIVTPARV